MSKVRSALELVRTTWNMVRLQQKHVVIFCISRDDSIELVETNLKLSCHIISKVNVEDVNSFRDPYTIMSFQKFLNEKQLGIYIYYQNEVIAHAWTIINEGNRRMRCNSYFLLRKNEALVHFCSVSPKFRGKKIYQHMLSRLYPLLFQSYAQLDHIFIDTDRLNLPAKNALCKTAHYVGNRIFFYNSFAVMTVNGSDT